MNGPWRALSWGVVAGVVVGGAGAFWLSAEPTDRLIVAAMTIPEGTTITVSMLEAREVPRRFMSRRKLGVTHVAGVLGQEAPHPLLAGDFIDPTHFGVRPDVCPLEARRLAAELKLETADAADFIERLAAEPDRSGSPPVPARR
ncbi:MAG: hypothetical protein INH41_06170 [Myxococcaceae bacterium]|jgi:hypothetical protein|nr:hypothetical protein [Myxococcaceae bacterium]MCA3011973.1 hypothetical protein [Myxococcaceae bacterium]